jgi:phage-related minor tail protein
MLDEQQRRIAETLQALEGRERQLDQGAKENIQALAGRQKQLDQQAKEKSQDLADRQEELRRQAKENSDAAAQRRQELNQQALALKDWQEQLDKRVVSYEELQQENSILKRDLKNIDVNLRKVQMDRDLQAKNQERLDARAEELGGRYLKENIKWIGRLLTPNNYAASKQHLLEVIKLCRGIGFKIPREREEGYLADLKAEFERIVRAAFEREEQARIKEQIREEQAREREIEQELKRLDRERAAIKAALDKALAEAQDKHSEEVERLKARLAEVEEKAKRAISQAQLTKSGHVYVISNIGSFGEGVFKIGMTRRLEPDERIRELSSASVPFPFDVHMMISANDAPTLENALHRELQKCRMNKARPRKEFFRTDIETVRQIVTKNHGEVSYVADPEALEYNQSRSMSDEDSEFIEAVYDAAAEESEATGGEE